MVKEQPCYGIRADRTGSGGTSQILSILTGFPKVYRSPGFRQHLADFPLINRSRIGRFVFDAWSDFRRHRRDARSRSEIKKVKPLTYSRNGLGFYSSEGPARFVSRDSLYGSSKLAFKLVT